MSVFIFRVCFTYLAQNFVQENIQTLSISVPTVQKFQKAFIPSKDQIT